MSGQSWPLDAVSTGLQYTDYTVAWICPLTIELRAATNMLDELHVPPSLPNNQKNIYTFGRICGHNVIIAGAGGMGPIEAATLGARMDDTFKLRFGLLVGIAGGLGVQLPRKREIFLGDVVISKSYGKDGGVVDGSLGRQAEHELQSRSFLNGVPEVLRKAFVKLEADHMDADSKATNIISAAVKRNSRFQDMVRPDPEKVTDVLFDQAYKHQGEEGNECAQCDKAQIKRERKETHTEPVVHFGLVVSGSQVIANSTKRAEIMERYPKALAVEMEGAGLMNISAVPQ